MSAQEHIGLTPAEKAVNDCLTAAWNQFEALPDAEHLKKDFADAVHAAQRTLCMRVARRANPEVWR